MTAGARSALDQTSSGMRCVELSAAIVSTLIRSSAPSSHVRSMRTSLTRSSIAGQRVRLAEAVMQVAPGRGIPAGVLNAAEDLLENDAQLRSREHWLPLEHPELGTVVTESWGYRLSETSPRQRRHAPLLGEHNDYVYREILGMSEEQIDDYMVEGIIQ